MAAIDVRDWRLAMVLGLLGAAAAACVFPYLPAMMPQVAARLHASPVPFPAVLVLRVLAPLTSR